MQRQLLNAVDVFKKAADHLIKQGERSHNDGECLYRDLHGRACAVGCLILDGVYHEDLEGSGATNADVIEALQDSGVDTQDPLMGYMLESLQKIHDEQNPDDWAFTLKALATSEDIDWEPPEKQE